MSVLTKTELAVVADLAMGLTQKSIAQRRFRSADTIKSHVASAMRRLNAKNSVHLIAKAKDMGLIMLVVCVTASAFSDVAKARRGVRLVRTLRVSSGRVRQDRV